MTEKQLQERVAYWQQRLVLLGVAHWRFQVRLVSQVSSADDADGMDVAAHVESSPYYDRAEFEFTRKALSEGKQYVDELIVHELLHVVDRDRDEAEEALLQYPSEAARNAEEARLRAVREAEIERFARQIVALHDEI